MNDNVINISHPKKIAEHFNKYLANAGLNIDREIPKPLKHFKDYMAKIKVNKTFFLSPATPEK